MSCVSNLRRCSNSASESNNIKFSPLNSNKKDSPYFVKYELIIFCLEFGLSAEKVPWGLPGYVGNKTVFYTSENINSWSPNLHPSLHYTPRILISVFLQPCTHKLLIFPIRPDRTYPSPNLTEFEPNPVISVISL